MHITYNTLAGDRGTHLAARIHDKQPSHGRSVEVMVWVPHESGQPADAHRAAEAVIELLREAMELVRTKLPPMPTD